MARKVWPTSPTPRSLRTRSDVSHAGHRQRRSEACESVHVRGLGLMHCAAQRQAPEGTLLAPAEVLKFTRRLTWAK